MHQKKRKNQFTAIQNLQPKHLIHPNYLQLNYHIHPNHLQPNHPIHPNHLQPNHHIDPNHLQSHNIYQLKVWLLRVFRSKLGQGRYLIR